MTVRTKMAATADRFSLIWPLLRLDKPQAQFEPKRVKPEPKAKSGIMCIQRAIKETSYENRWRGGKMKREGGMGPCQEARSAL